MKSFFCYILSSFFLSIYILSSTDGLMKTVAQFRFTAEGCLKSARYRYGDLYGISFLPEFKKEIWSERSMIKSNSCRLPRKVNLYSICDSYLWNYIKSDTIFCGVKSYKFSRWGFDGSMKIKLDTSQFNVLLIEVAERYFRITPTANYIDKIQFLRNTSSYLSTIGSIQTKTAGLSIRKEDLLIIYKMINNPDINQNLEFNLSDYPVFTPFKEMKALLNYRMFGHVPQEVSVIDGCPYLFLRETVDPLSAQSSFSPLADEEVGDIVNRLNAVFKYYRQNGFKEVLFSVIPNPVSVIYPTYNNYNDIIRRVQNHQDLLMPMINICDKLDSSRYQVFHNSDSHWNSTGFNLWVNEVNSYLKTIYKKRF